jgi:hypothetical protein
VSEGDIKPSGRFLLRVPPALHGRLRREARAAGTSLNEWCAHRLAGGGAAPDLVAHATAVLGSDLVGLVLHGSWARGEAGSASDVDVLVVVDSGRRLTRGLYREWDGEPQVLDGRVVDAHFVHLPGADGGGTAWSEAALDGIVVLDRGHEIARALSRVRRGLVAGTLLRRTVHGQPYTVKGA